MPSRSPNVLIIEDERDLADMYERWLSDRYDVEVAYDGETALAEIDSSVEVVILDRAMPGLSGDEVLSRIRDRRFDCRVAIVSAVEPDFDVVEMGFDDYLTKPVSRDDLVDVIEKLRLRNEYTDRVQEYFSLVSKKALLDSTKSERERRENERYVELEERIADLEDEVEALRANLRDVEDFEVAFRDISSGD